MKHVIAILAALLLVSCSVKKRTYRDGYYVDWAFKKKNTRVNNSVPFESTSLKAEEPVGIITVSTKKDLDVSSIMSSKLILPGDTCGDEITLKSGDRVLARVTEITEDKIKYKRCDNLEGPVFVVNKSTVTSVRYVNGVVEKIEAPAESVYTPKTNSTANDPYYGVQKVHPYAIASLVFLVLGTFLIGLGIIFSLIWSNRAIREITANPKKWKGLVLAKVVRSFSIVLLVLLALLIILLLATI